MQAALLLELLGHGRVHLGKVDHVVGRVFELRIRQRTRRPVGERVGFLQLHAADRVHEGTVADLLRLPEERRRDLRVEDRVRHAADVVQQDLDVLVAGMEHLHHVVVFEHRLERREVVDFERVDDDHLVVGRHLQQAQFRVVGLLA